ncbi:MAG: hypothetical protein ACREMG_12455 [Gemmatimonadales bacterium]
MDEDDSNRKPTLEGLRQDAEAMGLHYTGDSPYELEGLISLVRAKRGDSQKVRCFGLSYDPTDPRCRVCQLNNPCADLDKRPRVDLVQVRFLQAIPCGSCGTGVLDQALLDPDTRKVRDYSCTTRGCHNTVSIQCGFQDMDAKPPEEVTEIVLGVPPEPKAGKKPPAPEAASPGANGEPAPGEKPKLRIVRHAAPPKKKAPPPPPSTKPKGGPSVTTGQFVFTYDGREFETLNAIVVQITGSRAWSPKRFFGTSPDDVKDGMVLSRDWKGEKHKVVIKARAKT